MKHFILTIVIVLAFTTINAQSTEEYNKAAYLIGINRSFFEGKERSKYTMYMAAGDTLVKSQHISDMSVKAKSDPEFVKEQDFLNFMVEEYKEMLESNASVMSTLASYGFAAVKYIHIDEESIIHESITLKL